MGKADATVKGMVLAAGFGTRLRPLTDIWPKPLIPFLGSNPLALAIDQLQAAGIKDIAVNTHYLAEVVENFLTRSQMGNIRISREREILGTGGAYNPLRAWLGDSHLAVINGDIVSDIDVKAAVTDHIESGAVATMVLLPEVIPGESGVFHDAGRVTGIGKYGKRAANSGNFACMQVLSPAFFKYLPLSGSFDIISTAYAALLEQGLPITASIYDGIWHDIRSPRFYFDALCDCVTRRHNKQSFIDSSAFVEQGVALGVQVFIEADAQVKSGATLERCVILPGATIENNALVKNKIIGKNFSVELA